MGLWLPSGGQMNGGIRRWVLWSRWGQLGVMVEEVVGKWSWWV